MSKSIDLREAAAYYEERHALAETGKVFKAGKSTVNEWVKRKNQI